MNTIKAPKGTRDIFFPEIQKWQFLENAIHAYYQKFLYREIRTPIFEHSELFSRGIGSETEVVQKEMYTFQDKAGRSLTLRPENTASVVRAVIENNLFETMVSAALLLHRSDVPLRQAAKRPLPAVSAVRHRSFRRRFAAGGRRGHFFGRGFFEKTRYPGHPT